jgi:hypothetical protein
MNSSGSKSTACNESKRVNVGDPVRPQRDRVLANKVSKPRTPTSLAGSQMRRTTNEAQ